MLSTGGRDLVGHCWTEHFKEENILKEYKVIVDGQVYSVAVEEVAASGPLEDREMPTADFSQERPAEVKPEPEFPGVGNAIKVESPMPGSIIDIAVKPGDSVKEGDVLLILEAMKMENEITASQAGSVVKIDVQIGDTVDGGETLMVLS